MLRTASSSRALLSASSPVVAAAAATAAARYHRANLSTASSSPSSQWLSRQSCPKMTSSSRSFAAAGLVLGHRYYSATTNMFAEKPSQDTLEASESTTTESPPAPIAPPKPKRRIRKFFTYLFLTSAALFSSGVYLSLKSDNFHDFFSEYVPFGEEVVLYFEERDFRRRFPNSPETRAAAAAERLLVKPHSGVHAVPTTRDRSVQNSAVESPLDKVEHVVKPEKEEEKETEEGKAVVAEKQVLRAEKENTLIDIKVDESEVQNMIAIFNELAGPLNQEEPKYSNQINAFRRSILKVVEEIATIRRETKAAAEAEIIKLHQQFDESAKGLLKRIEDVRTEDAAQFREEFEIERERLSKSYSAKIANELSRAQELNEQRLRNELVEQAIEMNRKFVSDIHALVEKERAGRLSKIKELTANVAELESLTSEYNGIIDITHKTQLLQVAIDAVKSVLETRGDDDEDAVPRPFVRELAAVQAVAAADPVIATAIASIAPESYQHGIPTQAQIIDRFRRVASEVRKASLLPENAGITSHAASMLLSKILFKQPATTTATTNKGGKAVGEGDSTEDVLYRTQALLEEGNFDEAAREMNGLSGWAKMLSKDWLHDLRRVLEVKQALEIMETEARLRTLSIE